MGNTPVTLTNTLDKPATDEAILAALIAFANGARLTLVLGDKSLIATSAQRRGFVEDLEDVLKDRIHLKTLAPVLGLTRGIKLSYVIQGRAHGGLSLEVYRKFKTVRALLSFAVVLAMDPKDKSKSPVCRCKLQRCQAFFLERQNPKGGKPSRIYCSPAHLKEHHDSSNRRLGKV
jgi:hypothetical protein